MPSPYLPQKGRHWSLCLWVLHVGVTHVYYAVYVLRYSYCFIYILLHLVRILEELIKKPLRLVNGFLNICNFCTVIVTLKFTGQYMNDEVNF